MNAHKGVYSFQTRVRGREVHSSATHLGVNAVQHAATLVHFLTELADEMAGRAEPESGFDPPYTTVHVGTIRGGTAPEHRAAGLRLHLGIGRLMPGADPDEIRTRFEEFAAETVLPRMHAVDPGTAITTESRAQVPGLVPEDGSPAEAIVMALARTNHTEVVAYGTEAGLFQEVGIPTVICGPGSILQAHQPNEYIEVSQVHACEAFMRRLARRGVRGLRALSAFFHPFSTVYPQLIRRFSTGIPENDGGTRDMGGASLERHGAIGVITIDNPPVNAMSVGVPGAILSRLEEAEADDAIEAIVLRGGGRGALAGADIGMFGRALARGRADPARRHPRHRALAQAGHRARSPATASAAGSRWRFPATTRVASRETGVGQPEVALGFPPGAGGTQRLPRIANVSVALAMIVDGTRVPAEEAAEHGILDRVIEGRPAARRRRLRGGAGRRRPAAPACARPHAGAGRSGNLRGHPRTPGARRARGQRAPLACLECVEMALTLPFDEGIRREREVFEDCMTSAESRALRHVFFAERQARRVPGIGKETPVRPVERAAIIGAGTMGTGIATCFANAGIPVRLTDSDGSALERALAAIRNGYESRVARGRIGAAETPRPAWR